MSLLLVAVLGLVGCGGGAGESAAPAASESAENTTSNATIAATGELVGKPWVSSYISGNLPVGVPEAKDDIYTHFNYDFISAHQEEETSEVALHSDELQSTIVSIIGDESQTGHELEQLRIFYNQAADTDALKAIGTSEIQPYLDRVDAVSSIEDFNALIADKDFPFVPFFQSTIATAGTRNNAVVKVNANLLFSEAELLGGQYYQDSDDEQTQQTNDAVLSNGAIPLVIDLMAQGADQESAAEFSKQAIAFEKTYGKYVDYDARYITMPYGEYTNKTYDALCTYDELVAMFSNVPIEKVLDKLEKLGSEKYLVTKAWAKALNDEWTAENLDGLKTIAKATVIMETLPYRDQSVADGIKESLGLPASDVMQNAYTACDNINTFGQVLGKLYVNSVAGEEGKERLVNMTQDLLDTYKGLFAETPWMGDESKANAIEKLETMSLNLLEPKEGYFDYSGLELATTDKGGTLLGNYFRLRQYRYDCESKLINQPAVAGSVFYSDNPTIANAFYEPSNNSINIMPGFLSTLTYTNEMDDAELLSGIGGVVGHEISHGFDYCGSQYNAYAEPNSIYADNDLDAFMDKTNKLAEYYSAVEVMPGVNVDGEYVVVEAAADLSGTQAVLALMEKSESPDYERFFGHLSDLYAMVTTEDGLAIHLADSHPLNNLRVNVNVQMFDSTYDALGITESDGMYLAPDKRIVIFGSNA